MGKAIWSKMVTNDMQLNKPLFIIGNLAPDLNISFVFRLHTYKLCAPYVNKLLQRLYRADKPNCPGFSFITGVLTHYLCDFCCYPHTAAFSGSVRDHVLYEKKQNVKADEMLPFTKSDSMYYGLKELSTSLIEQLKKRERVLIHVAEKSNSDIPQAIHVATWAASAVYLHAQQMNNPFAHVVPQANIA